MTRKTIGQISAEYDATRERILERVRLGHCSASMSGLDFMDKPFADLDPSDKIDAITIRHLLGWRQE